MLKIFTKSEDKGFTLVELLIVIAIIGVLAAIAIPIYLAQADNANRAAAESQASSLQSLMLNGVALGTYDTGTMNGQHVQGATLDVPSVGTLTVTDGTYITNYVAADNFCVSVTVGGQTASLGTGAKFNSSTTACDWP